MDDTNFDGAKKIHINCPYCWGEFKNFEQIGSSIDYNHRSYENFLIFPIESKIVFPHFLFFGRQQQIEKIKCPHCGREYTIVLLPFGLSPKISSNTEKKIIKKESLKSRFLSWRDQFNTIPSFIQTVSKWRYFLIFNWFLILLTIFEFIEKNYVLFFSFFMILICLTLIKLMLPSFSNYVSNFVDVQKIPLLIHKNYIKSSYFTEFKNYFFTGESSHDAEKDLLDFLLIILITTIWGSFILVSYSIITASGEIFSKFISILAFFGMFQWMFYLCLMIFLYAPSLINSMKFLSFILSHVPFEINPWDNVQKVEQFKKLWLWSFTLCLFILVTIPIALELSTIIKMLSDSLVNQDLSVLLSSIKNTSFLGSVVYFSLIFVLCLIFIRMLYNFNKNVERRKSDILSQMRKEIVAIKRLKNPSNHDVIKESLLLKKAEKIKEIPTFSFKQLIQVIITLITFATPLTLNYFLKR